MKEKTDLKIVYFGTPELAVSVLDELDEAGLTPALIVTAPDRPAGRGLELKAPPVKKWAEEHNVTCIQPESLAQGVEVDVLMNSEWDLFIVAAYGKILPKAILALPVHGTLNVHPSLLPKFRGPSPIESQILADERTVGVSIMLLDEEVDHGPIVSQASIELDTFPIPARELEGLLASEGGALLAESILPYVEGELKPEPQDHSKATFTRKIKKEDGLIDLAGDGYQNYLKFCAYDEWPGVFYFEDSKRIKITEAEYTNGLFKPLRIVPEGKKEQDYRS